MNTEQLRKILLSDIYVRRTPLVQVIPRDKLQSRIDQTKPAAFIVNTDPSYLPGQHWIAIYFDGLGHVEYFDSFGLPPMYADISTFIRRNSNKPLLYNARPLQHLLSSACGLYAIHFLLVKCRGGSLQRALMPFHTSHRQHTNDRLVARLVRPYLHAPI